MGLVAALVLGLPCVGALVCRPTMPIEAFGMASRGLVRYPIASGQVTLEQVAEEVRLAQSVEVGAGSGPTPSTHSRQVSPLGTVTSGEKISQAVESLAQIHDA